MDLWVIFLTGLTIGGLTCMAVQGGLLAATIAARKKEIPGVVSWSGDLLPTLAFLITKLIAYTILGFLLGAFGGVLGLSDTARVVIQIFAALYMIAIALSLLDVHPIFRYAVIQPPRFLMRVLRSKVRGAGGDVFAPAVLGLMMVFVPCGTTLAMEAYAVSSANAFHGAAIMGVFVLGTTPLFFGLGFLTSVLSDTFRRRFLKLAAVLVLYLGVTSFNGALVLAGSPVTLQNLSNLVPVEVNFEGEGVAEKALMKVEGGVQVADISVYPTSYTPNYIRAQAGVPVKLSLTTNGIAGCTSVFTIPSLGIRKTLPRSGTDFIEFTPRNVGKLTWTCAMGMYSGIIDVVPAS